MLLLHTAISQSTLLQGKRLLWPSPRAAVLPVLLAIGSVGARPADLGALDDEPERVILLAHPERVASGLGSVACMLRIARQGVRVGVTWRHHLVNPLQARKSKTLMMSGRGLEDQGPGRGILALPCPSSSKAQ